MAPDRILIFSCSFNSALSFSGVFSARNFLWVLQSTREMLLLGDLASGGTGRSAASLCELSLCSLGTLLVETLVGDLVELDERGDLGELGAEEEPLW